LSDCVDEDNGGAITHSQPIISRCDPLPILEMAKHPFNDITASVCGAVERIGKGTSSTARNDSFNSLAFESRAEPIRVVGFVSNIGRKDGNSIAWSKNIWVRPRSCERADAVDI
jgi:hypothetical protein